MPDSWSVGLKDDFNTACRDIEASGIPNTSLILEDAQAEALVNPNNIDQAKVPQVVTDVKRICDTLITKVENDPKIYYDALIAMVNNFDKLSTAAGMFSALPTFGKYSGHKRRHSLVFAGNSIGVQPAAVARRFAKCFGRKVAALG